MKLKYRLSNEELERLLDASKPVPYIVVGACVPESPQDKANRVWQEIAKTHGFIWNSAKPAGTGDDHDLFAEPVPPVESLIEKIAEAVGEKKS